MRNYKQYFFCALSIISINSIGQEIDPSIISQLSPEQIEMAKGIYLKENSLENSDETLPNAIETLVTNKSINDANKVSGKKYGYDFFSSMPTSLAAVGDLPLPNDYIISLRDQFTVILSGSRDQTFNLNVKLDGTVLFPEIGSISVAGLTFKEVKDKLSDLIAQAYIGVNIDVSLENLSAKKITIVGAVNTPGTYLVNPFTTITGALAYSGGISDIGSLRDIRLIRNNKEIFSFDLYDLLIKGDRSNDINIQAGDTILINAASQFVEITGAVKRPAIYEVLGDETIENIIEFALGFTPTANKSNISASYLDLNASLIVRKNIDNLDQSLENVLSLNIFNYVSEESSSIRVLGAIDEPGFYDIEKYKNLDDLLADLKFIDVYPWLAVIEQFDKNKLIQSSVLFNLNDPSTFQSIQLLPNSRIYFANIEERSFDVSNITENLIQDYQLKINHQDDTFILPVYGKFSVSSFIDLLGLDMSDVDEIATYISPLDSIVVNDNYKNMKFISKKYHTVSFRSPENDLITVNVRGAVEFPGTYSLNDSSTVEDLFKLVGKLKSQAYPEGIILTREVIRERQIKSIEKSRENLNKAIINIAQTGENIGDINLLMSLSEEIDPENLGRLAGDFSPRSEASLNTNLFDGDTLIVPKNPNAINVFGEVLNPIAFEFTEKITVKSAIDQAGGFQQFADKRRVYVIKANGIVQRANRNLFAGSIDLKPGDTVVVPRKIITNNPGIQFLVPITQLLSDIAFSAAALDSLSNN